MKHSTILFALLVSAELTPGRASACNVPVFRYALERWIPDDFAMAAPAEPTNLVAALRAAPLNLAVAPGTATNAIVRYPQGGPDAVLWRGPFTADHIRVLVDSPARRALVREFQQGAAAVWILLESGNVEADDDAAQLAATELARLQSELRIPEIDPDDPRTANNATLRIVFTVLRVARTDPAERLFVAMLLGAGTGMDRVTGPILFPVFGRGRVLAGLAGDELTAAHIAGAAEFLCGTCSCEVKTRNPGWDLLIAADWDAVVESPVVKDPELPPLISLSAIAAAARPAAKPLPAPPAPAPDAGPLARNVLLVLGIAVVTVAIGTFCARRQR